MARYIDAERFDVVTFQRCSEDFMDGMDYILDMIENAPTEDVVPRSEVEKAKQEVARAMIEEFEGNIEILHQSGNITGNIMTYWEIFKAELKKKYIGE